MSDKKNIERLFQERFKDFEVEPPPHVWKNVQHALKEEKKERKLVPFWYKIAGIAALLTIGFLTFDTFFDVTEIDNKVVFDTPKNSDTNQKNNKIIAPVNSKNSDAETGNVLDKKQKTVVVNPVLNSENDEQKAISKTSKKNNEKNFVLKKETVFYKKNAFATTLSFENKNKTDEAEAVTLKKNSVTSIEKTLVVNDENNSNKKPEIKKNSVVLNSTEKIQNNKESNVEKVARKTIVDTIVDKNTSIAIENTTSNALEALLEKKEEEKKKKVVESLNRWQLTSNVAPIYYNSASNGSPIDAQFAENDKTYENNMSFGLGVNYVVNKKISVRTGVNKFSVGYNTNNVLVSAGLNSQSLKNINGSATSNISIQNVAQSDPEALAFENAIQGKNEGAINQKMGYYEVPVELSYAVVNKKFGINVIGGLSTLFLNQNEVSVVSSGMSTSIGKASNLNDIHFSTNVGLGFRYEFLKSFEAKFEPMFKYQINTFSNDSGNFKPYFIGLYSGVSFSF